MRSPQLPAAGPGWPGRGGVLRKWLEKGRRGWPRGHGSAVLGALLIAGSVVALGSSAGAATGRSPGAKGVEQWQSAMGKLPVPGKGCFSGHYPQVKWLPSPCGKRVNEPFLPTRRAVTPPYLRTAPAQRPVVSAGGPAPQIVGNGTDYSAEVSGLISSVTGSFDSVVVPASPLETGLDWVTHVTASNIYSLQISTKPFATTSCTGSGDPSCLGWEQFIYSASPNQALIQYWLLGYLNSCPAGFSPYPTVGHIDCYSTPLGASLPGGVPAVANLTSDNVQLTGTATAGNDTVKMTDVSGQAIASSSDSLLHLAAAWKGAEFAIVGDGGGSQAVFPSGSTVQVRTVVHDGTMVAPTCVLEGFTGETNNLDLSDAPTLTVQAAPTIVSTQTNSNPLPADCATASSWGDTHLMTFGHIGHLSTEFQARGNFELATAGPGFQVQTQQVADRHIPAIAFNNAVGIRLGHSVVTLCLAPTRLVINGRRVVVRGGGSRLLPGGDQVAWDGAGDTYLSDPATKDYVSAVVGTQTQPTQNYLSLYLGLGRWSGAMHGLLGSAPNDPYGVVSRGGTVLPGPSYNFSQYYHVYGDSWRLTSGKSMLSVCGGKVPSGDPVTTENVSNLPHATAATARRTCLLAGVKSEPLLDDCTLDVAVFRDKDAALIYRTLPTNLYSGKILPPRK